MDKKFEELSYSQQLDIAHTWINEEDAVTVVELFTQIDEVYDEVLVHPDYLTALPLVDKDAVWKMHMAEAEMDVSARWAYKIYLHVKSVLEKENKT